jgi:hypothetical protein
MMSPGRMVVLFWARAILLSSSGEMVVPEKAAGLRPCWSAQRA